MISRLFQLNNTTIITIKPSRILSSSPHCNHGNKLLHNSTDFQLKILKHGRTSENTSQITSRYRASQTTFQLTPDLRGTLRATLNLATVGSRSSSCINTVTRRWLAAHAFTLEVPNLAVLQVFLCLLV